MLALASFGLACDDKSAPPPTVPPTEAPTTTKPAVAQTPATIVLVAPVSGERARLGAQAREGLELSLRHAVEDGRIPDDLSISVRVLDEQSKGIARAVDRALADKKVIAVVGGVLEGTEALLTPITVRRKVPLFILTWNTPDEPVGVVRFGPASGALAQAAADSIVRRATVGSSALIYSTTSSNASITVRDAVSEALVGPSVIEPRIADVSAQSPSDPVAVSNDVAVVVGPAEGAFKEIARLRPSPYAAAPSIVVPVDANGCGVTPVGVPDGTRCASRGAWMKDITTAGTFREDAAASYISPSWVTATTYDLGTFLIAVAGQPIAADTSVADLRTAIGQAHTSPAAVGFIGVNGAFTLGRGFETGAQVMLARRGAWVAEPASG